MGRVAPSAWADPHVLSVLNNATVNANSSLVQTLYGMKEITVVVNLTGAISGTSPTLEVTLAEVDPGDQTTVIGTSTTTGPLTANGVAIITLRTTRSGTVQVAVTVGGVTPSFAGVYVTLTAKSTTAISAVDPDGNEVSVLADAAGNPGVSMDAYSGSYPDPMSVPDGTLKPAIDGFGNMMTRGPVLTDEQSTRDDFVGASLTTALTGTLNWTNGSAVVTGTGTTFATQVKIGQYIKKTADAEAQYVQVFSVDSDTQITLHDPYTGTTAAATGVVSNWKTDTGTGTSIGVASSLVTLNTGTTSGSQVSLFREVDYGPFTFLSQLSLSQRIANQEFRAGFSDAPSVTPGYAAFFRFNGTNNTLVDCVSQSSAAAADQQVTSITLPEGLTSATQAQYRIDISNSTVTFIIAGDVVARHSLHIPSPYGVMGALLLARNTGAAGSTTAFSSDVLAVQNFNLLQIAANNIGEPIPVKAVDKVSVGTLGALNATASIELDGGLGAGIHIAAGTLIGTVIPEISYNGSTWIQSQFWDPTAQSFAPSLIFTAANPSTARTIVTPPGTGFARVRVSAFTSGTTSCTLRSCQPAPSAVTATVIDGPKASYSASIRALAVAANPTDIFTLTGSATRVVRIKRVVISPIKTTASQVVFLLLKRSTANAGGVSTSPAAVPEDSQDGAATAVPRAYTTNPGALGTLVGNIRSLNIFTPAAATATRAAPYTEVFGGEGMKLPVLRGTGEVFAVNLNGVTMTGGAVSVSIDWTEEPL